ncbi:MAG: alkaline phosphatase D family protein [Bacteroidia bacterium]
MRYVVTLYGLLLWAQPTSPMRAFVDASAAPFYHGVASGDPLTDRVILWTRVTPAANWTGPLTGSWQVAQDTNFQTIVANGNFTTDADKDYTVHVEATGLQPGTWYYYRFEVDGSYSPTGRTRTLPSGNLSRLRLAVVSCAAYDAGYYVAYRKIVERNDVDFVVHLGDYIYEYGPQQNSLRPLDPPREILTLSDYRMRYSHHRLDSDLRWLHQNYPIIAVWDDHELANDAWKAGAENHDPGTEGDFNARKKAMLKAYYEWMPIRLTDPNDSLRIWRKFTVGNLADLIMLDTRHYARDKQPTSPNDLTTINDPTRTMLGSTQRNWLFNQLRTSTARWRIIGQQVMFAPLEVNIPLVGRRCVNVDQWDGYAAERATIAETLKNYNQVAILTGDIHTSWANDLPFGPGTYDPTTGNGSTAVEFVTPSITSGNASFLGSVNPSVVQSQNPYVKYVNLTQHGYIIIDVQSDTLQGDWYFVSDVSNPNATESFSTGWYVKAGERFLRQARGPKIVSNYNPSIIDSTQVTTIEVSDALQVVGIYPNPVEDFFTLQLYTPSPMSISLYLHTPEGKELAQYTFQTPSAGTHYYRVPAPQKEKGVFFLTLVSPTGKKVLRLAR